MKAHEAGISAGLVILLLVVWLGFLVHRAPRFAGSGLGGALAVTGALLMLAPLAYLVIKRVAPVNRCVTKFVTMRTLLKCHIFAGIVGPILVVLHTGHKFESALGAALTAMTLVVVASGFIGHYLLSRISASIREKRDALAQLEIEYRNVSGTLASDDAQRSALRVFSGLFERPFVHFLSGRREDHATNPLTRTIALVDTMADVEFSIRIHSTFKAIFSWWLRFHIALALVLYVLLTLHVWSGIHFGLRWFQ